MAVNAVATINIFGYPKGVSNDQRMEYIHGTISFVQGQYPPGGFPLNWQLEPIKSIPAGAATQQSTGTIQPIDVDAKSTAFPPSGIVWVWDSVNGNLHAFISADASSNASGPLIEFGGPALPGWMLNDVVQFCAVFARSN